MKKDSYHNYVGKKFLDAKLEKLNSPKATRKCNQFIRRIDSIFLELDKIINAEKRAYIALSLKKQFAHELYNDLRLRTKPTWIDDDFTSAEETKMDKIEDNIKDEIFGYLKFKTNWHSHKQYQKSKRYNPTKKKFKA